MRAITLTDTTSEVSLILIDLMYAIVLSLYLKPAPNDSSVRSDVTPKWYAKV
jgi:hypothetical protein